MEQLNAANVVSERWYNMSIITKLSLFEFYNKAHKIISPYYVIEYESGVVEIKKTFKDLPKQAKKIIKNNHYTVDYKKNFYYQEGKTSDLYSTIYERKKSL